MDSTRCFYFNVSQPIVSACEVLLQKFIYRVSKINKTGQPVDENSTRNYSMIFLPSFPTCQCQEACSHEEWVQIKWRRLIDISFKNVHCYENT